MRRIWNSLKTNSMYWRFRYVTRNRVRLRNWWNRNKPGRPGIRAVPYSGARGRGTARQIQYVTGASRRSWLALLVMVALLTAVHEAVGKGTLAGGLGGIIDTLIVVGAIYFALRSV